MNYISSPRQQSLLWDSVWEGTRLEGLGLEMSHVLDAVTWVIHIVKILCAISSCTLLYVNILAKLLFKYLLPAIHLEFL